MGESGVNMDKQNKVFYLATVRGRNCCKKCLYLTFVFLHTVTVETKILSKAPQ